MEIILAKTAGFCFGVNKAVKTAFDSLEKSNGSVCSLGPLIHNNQVVGRLNELGMKVVMSADEIEDEGQVIIRAHGVSPAVYDEIRSRKLSVVDATCPYVAKIQRLVSEKYNEGYSIVIVGDENHPEVKGINGWCGNTAEIVDSVEDADKLDLNDKKVCIVAQTTITGEKWREVTELLNNKFKNVIKFDTICNATSMRQAEAREIAGAVDMMLVVGGKSSSNTQKLFEICSKYCPNTHKIETAGDIPPVDIKKIKKIGITAGASTPDWVIKEVIDKMDELKTEELNKAQETEVSFKEAFEESLVTLQTGQIVKGRIVGYNNAEVYVDMGFKSDGIISLDEFTNDPDFNPDESIKIGEEIEVFVVRVNDGEGTVQLSKKKVDAIKSWDDIEEAYNNKTPIKARIFEVVNGGVLANAKGVRVFIPASQVSDRYVKDLQEFLKQTLDIRIVEYNKQKRRVVGSHKAVAEEEKAKLSEELWSSIEVGKEYSGTVKSLTKFGAFVDIGGVDGLVHISEMSWSRIKDPSEVFKVGDKVKVTILDFDSENKRISLGYRKAEDNPWAKAAAKYNTGDIVTGKVVRLVPFGAFVELDEGVDGLVHISQISSARIGKPGDVLEVGQAVEAKIIEFNAEAKKISLSIKEVAPIDPPSSKREEEQAAQKEGKEEELPSEHKEDDPVTIGDIVGDIKSE